MQVNFMPPGDLVHVFKSVHVKDKRQDIHTLHHLHLLRVLLIALHRVDIQFLSKIQKDKKKFILNILNFYLSVLKSY